MCPLLMCSVYFIQFNCIISLDEILDALCDSLSEGKFKELNDCIVTPFKHI